MILENPAYMGDYANSRTSYGKYRTIAKACPMAWPAEEHAVEIVNAGPVMPRPPYSCRGIPASRMTLVYAARSAVNLAANCSGVVPTGS